MQAITLNEAAQDLLSVIGRVNYDHEPLVVTYEHHKSAVIMSLDYFNAWQEKAYRSNANAVRRKPSAKIAGKGQILGDIMTPVVAAEDWRVQA
ncbi:MAG: type II toxin-antitoxin system prevent-host-death family antitoxin [Pseudomonadota bacterium]